MYYYLMFEYYCFHPMIGLVTGELNLLPKVILNPCTDSHSSTNLTKRIFNCAADEGR